MTMVRVLLIHNSEVTNREYRRNFVKKYKHFETCADTWALTVIKYGFRMPRSDYDKIYYDEATLRHVDIYDDYVRKNRKSADVLPIKKPGGKMFVNITTKITNLQEGGDA